MFKDPRLHGGPYNPQDYERFRFDTPFLGRYVKFDCLSYYGPYGCGLQYIGIFSSTTTGTNNASDEGNVQNIIYTNFRWYSCGCWCSKRRSQLSTSISLPAAKWQPNSRLSDRNKELHRRGYTLFPNSDNKGYGVFIGTSTYLKHHSL